MLKTIVLRQFDRHLPCVILLGGFDGLHLGHKRLVARAKAFGLPIGIMTIDDCKATGNLFNAVEREEIFAKEGIDFVLEMSFAKIKDLSPEKFIELLKKDRTVKTFVCGTDFRFGAGAKGPFAKSSEKRRRIPYTDPALFFAGKVKETATAAAGKVKATAVSAVDAVKAKLPKKEVTCECECTEECVEECVEAPVEA